MIAMQSCMRNNTDKCNFLHNASLPPVVVGYNDTPAALFIYEKNEVLITEENRGYQSYLLDIHSA